MIPTAFKLPFRHSITEFCNRHSDPTFDQTVTHATLLDYITTNAARSDAHPAHFIKTWLKADISHRTARRCSFEVGNVLSALTLYQTTVSLLREGEMEPTAERLTGKSV